MSTLPITLGSVSTSHEPRRPGRPPGADGAETRRRILHAARAVFSSTGFDRATLEEIAREAGITRNAISNYYPNKIELHRAAFASIHADAMTEIMSGLPGPGSPVVDRIMGLFVNAIAVNEKDLSFVRFWVTSTLDGVHHPELREQADRQFSQVRRYFQDVLEDGKARGEVREDVKPSDVAQVVLNLLWGLAMDAGFRSTPARVQNTLVALRQVLDGAVLRERTAVRD